MACFEIRLMSAKLHARIVGLLCWFMLYVQLLGICMP